MPWPVHPTGFFGARGDQDTYKIERSLRFNSADSAYLNRTPASAGNRKTWTWSGWVKRGKLGTTQSLFARYTANTGSGLLTFIFWNDDTLRLISGSTDYRVTTAKYRDVSSWYHLVCSVDTTNATANNRIRFYVNGSEVTSFSTTNNFNQNDDTQINENVAHYIGYYLASVEFDGYLTEINFIDGQALTPSSFGETDAITGRWKAKAYGGTYGTNGFYLKFADNSGTTDTTLGKDSSGNGNNWTPNNFSVTAGADNDSLLDSPTNNGTSGNYATLNPLQLTNSATPPNNGNLTSPANTGAWRRIGATIQLPTTGKWYFEYNCDSFSSFATFNIGVFSGGIDTANDNPGYLSTEWMYDGQNGYAINNNTSISSGFTAATTGDVLQLAYDASTGSIWFGKNNTWQGAGSPNPATGTSPTYNSVYNITPLIAQNWATQSVNFGQRPFAYTAPAGFRSLCTTNLPQPTIQKPSKYMDVVTYTGTGASNSISSLGFSPDLVWIKNRGGATSHAIYDTTRGTQAQLSSDTTGDEVTSSTGLTAFGLNGFTVGTSSLVNTSGTQYVAWAWDEAPIAGMDIVSYTGTGVARTIAHNLGVAPKMMIVKNRTSALDSWAIYHSVLGAGKYLLFTTGAEASSVNIWNNTSPTSSVFSVGITDDTNRNNGSFIAYLFAEVEGFSKFGSYTGNGSADGPFVWCGFRPRWVMIKNITTGGTNYDWVIADSARETFNVTANNLAANTSASEASGILSQPNDFISNGFKLRASGGNAYPTNASGSTYIFAAFSESPFKYARAR